MNYENRKIRNLEVSAIDMGCMGFLYGYGALPPKDDAIKKIVKFCYFLVFRSVCSA